MFVTPPRSLNIRSLLGDQDSYYQIPDYQRPYSWGTDEVEKLWDDLYTAWCRSMDSDTNEERYFLGSIVLSKPSSSADDQKHEDKGIDDERYDVVDGQQRLITLIIFCCIIRDIIKTGKIITNDIISADQFEELIFKSDKRLTIMSHTREFIDKYNLILEGGDFDSKRLTKKEQAENKFHNSAQIFYRKFIDNDDDFTDDNSKIQFIRYILRKVDLILITCENHIQAIRIFQTLNATGLDLSTADLIKSFLFSNIVGRSQEKENRGVMQYEWNQLEDLTERVDVNLEKVLLYYAYSLKGGDIKKDLYSSLTGNGSYFHKIAIKDPHKSLKSIKDYAEKYDQIINSNNKDIYALRYLRQEIYWRTIITSVAYYKEINVSSIDWDELSRDIMRFYYMYWISGYTISKVKQISFNIFGWIKSGESNKFIRNKLEEKIISDKVIEATWMQIRGEYVYQKPWCKPLLVAIDMNMHEEGVSIYDYRGIDKKIHVEHIFPQTPKLDEWQGITEPENKLHSLANLTLLTGTQNIKAGNKPFSQKLQENYLGKDGKGKDGITSFVITQLLRNYEESGWIDSSYLDRKKWMEGQISKLLKIDIPK